MPIFTDRTDICGQTVCSHSPSLLLDHGRKPGASEVLIGTDTLLLNIDIWEHAYYLKHYNMRSAYIDDWFQVINWSRAEERFQMRC